MKRLLQNGNGKRLMGAGIGMAVANFVVAIVVDQFGVPLHLNVVASGSVLLAAVVNFILGKYLN